MSAGNRYLVYQLYGPMAAWGDIAVGEARVTSQRPGRSALLGLLAAALGLKRTDESTLADLSASVRFGVLTLSSGHFLRDYHTAQVPPGSALKHRPARTRRDELSVPKDELGTILSSRDYRTDSLYRIAVAASENDAFTLEELERALLEPVFPLYLGRKACPPALPLQPHIIAADNLLEAFRATHFQGPAELLSEVVGSNRVPKLNRPPYALSWEDEMESGIDAERSASRRDQPRTRRRWQFDERIEHQAMIENLEEAACS